MKKKFGAVIMAGAMACTLIGSAVAATGCTTKIPDFVMPEGGFDTEAEVEIKFYHTMGQNLRPILQNYIAEFNTLYPNIKVIEDQIGGYEDVRDQVVTEINSGAQPNLAYCYPDHVAMFNQSGAVLPLNGFLADGEYKDMTLTRVDKTEESLGFTQAQQDDFIQGYWKEGFQFGDGTNMYTLPFAKSTEILFYNKTFFEKHNLSVPTTWDEMEEVCAAIKAIDPNCTPLGYDSEANWFITMCEQLGSPYTSADGKHFLFDNQTNRDFVTRFSGWYEKGYVTTKELSGVSYTSNLFVAQTSYMSIGSSAGAAKQCPAEKDGSYPFKVGIASIPQVHPDNPKVISQGPSICIFKQDNPQEVLASWLLAKFLTTNIGFQAEFASAQGYVPVIKSVENHKIYKEKLEEANDPDKNPANLASLAINFCLEQEEAYYTSPAFVGSAKARDQVGYLMQAAFNKSKSVEKAFTDALEECVYHFGE